MFKLGFIWESDEFPAYIDSCVSQSFGIIFKVTRCFTYPTLGQTF